MNQNNKIIVEDKFEIFWKANIIFKLRTAGFLPEQIVKLKPIFKSTWNLISPEK